MQSEHRIRTNKFEFFFSTTIENFGIIFKAEHTCKLQEKFVFPSSPLKLFFTFQVGYSCTKQGDKVLAR